VKSQGQKPPADQAAPLPNAEDAPDLVARAADTAAFLEQARWLLAWHQERATGLASRAVSMLGFVGVILALVPAGVSSSSDPGLPLRITMVCACFSLFVTAVLCLLVLAPRPAGAPQIRQLREQWADYVAQNRVRDLAVATSITEGLLFGTLLDSPSPLDLAREDADGRAKWFKRATFGLLVSTGAVALLVLQLLW